MAETPEQISARFPIAATSPRPSDGAIRASVDLRNSTDELGQLINDSVPDGRYKALALTALEETLMWANKGVHNS